MADEQQDTGTIRGARFTEADFNGATFRDCDLRNLKVVMREECEHHRYAVRDLVVLEART